MVQLTDPPLSERPVSRRRRVGVAGLAIVGGLAVFVGGTPYFDLWATNDSWIYNGALTVAFGLLAVRLHKTGWRAYAETCQALFVAAGAMLVMVIGPFNWLVMSREGTAQHAFQDKLAQFLAVVPVIFLLAWSARGSDRWLYLQRGRLRRWLVFGVAALVLSAVAVTLVALGDGIGVDEILSAAPWVLGFAALNAVMEELWFRGIFLGRYEEHLGATTAVLLTALVFGAAHIGATYISAAQQLAFAALVVGLGAILGWAVRWANSLWGAVLIHIGLDLVVLLELAEGA